ncbi:RdgB/HAM1 family non-canonical purine NTP pyrophosphatase [Synechococcus sp. CBW1006]|nr:RdgB/HAM1 family non-canonical purine NTP pyrophosphatase [Synechococcus sp. CBW1006]
MAAARSIGQTRCCDPLAGAQTPDRSVLAASPSVLVIASGNAHKVAEITAMLHAVGLEVRQQPEGLEIEETGRTYLENARLKAQTVATLTGCWALADDSGLEVDALGGAPGLYSARYAPTDHERIHRLLQELGGTPYRSASFNSAMVLADPTGQVAVEAEGICRGEILITPQGHGGGYDPIFWVREAGLSYAQLPHHLKEKLGSRGKAARQMAPRLLQLLGLAAA